jgi:hypothetical protein
MLPETLKKRKYRFTQTRTLTPVTGLPFMKTMLELLIRLYEMRRCCERVKLNPQLTNGEKAVARFHKQIVRECLPPEVLIHYDRMKKTERPFLSCPEVFGMAVLVSTYLGLPPHQRKKLVAHFTTSSPTLNIAIQGTRTAKRKRRTGARFKAVIEQSCPR